MTVCTRKPSVFSSCKTRKIEVDQKGCAVTSDAGPLLLRQADWKNQGSKKITPARLQITGDIMLPTSTDNLTATQTGIDAYRLIKQGLFTTCRTGTFLIEATACVNI